ncbi:MAG: hypothetical protein QOJ11_1582 [Frankiales bacterium]|jgi:signal transduction histidine kinase|nr:hypothetical protein [Frankiales bacterium]
MRSVKAKLGVLVVGTVVMAMLAILVALYLGIRVRYSLPVGTLLALAFVQVVGHGLTAPVREMARAAPAMARGDYEVRVRATSRDEVGELARAFNSMAADLAEVDRRRREMVANVSHELRTPVTALQALLENLVDGVSTPDDATLRGALAQTQRLGRLVTSLLDVARLESGGELLDLRDLPLKSLFDEVVAQAGAAGLATPVDVTVDPPDLCMAADPDRMHQVLGNLLDNAGRHSPPGGRIALEGSATADGVAITVTDQGPGIPYGQREQVFQRFARGDQTAASSDGGTGLGLAIARSLVDQHGGILAVVEHEGGCRFRLELPTPTPHNHRGPR